MAADCSNFGTPTQYTRDKLADNFYCAEINYFKAFHGSRIFLFEDTSRQPKFLDIEETDWPKIFIAPK